MAIVAPDPKRSQRKPSNDPAFKLHPAARWTMPLVLAASGALWGLIAYVLGRD